MQILKVFQCHKIMEGKIQKSESKIQQSLVQANIKNMFFAVMAINYYMLMIGLLSLLRHTEAKINLTILLIISLKKVNIAVK